MPASIVYFLITEKWWKKMKTNVWNVNQQFAKYSICYLIIYSSSQTICCLFIKKCFGLFVVPWEFVKNCWKCRDNFWAVSSESKAWVEVRPRADWIMRYAIIRCISLPSVALHAGMSTAGRGLGHRVERGEVRWWCPCPSAPSSPPLSSYERQQNHTNMIQCSVWGGHIPYHIPSVWCALSPIIWYHVTE